MDSTRKDTTTKVQDTIIPDSSKSTTDKVGENVTTTGDKIQRDVVPDSQKSTTQALSDKTSREKDAHSSNEGVMDKAKHAVGMDKKHDTTTTSTTHGDSILDSSKSTTGGTLGAEDTTATKDKSMLDKAKSAVGMDKHN